MQIQSFALYEAIIGVNLGSRPSQILQSNRWWRVRYVPTDARPPVMTFFVKSTGGSSEACKAFRRECGDRWLICDVQEVPPADAIVPAEYTARIAS